jgi:hypothetical protein
LAASFALIAGALAYYAGVRQARETRQAADRQLSAAAKKNRLQACCITAGIWPEIARIKGDRIIAARFIREALRIAPADSTAVVVTELMHPLHFQAPSVLSSNVDHLYLLDGAGPKLLQLVSVILQYNERVEEIARQTTDCDITFEPAAHADELSSYLEMMNLLLTKADLPLDTLYEEALMRGQSHPLSPMTTTKFRTEAERQWLAEVSYRAGAPRATPIKPAVMGQYQE